MNKQLKSDDYQKLLQRLNAIVQHATAAREYVLGQEVRELIKTIQADATEVLYLLLEDK